MNHNIVHFKWNNDWLQKFIKINDDSIGNRIKILSPIWNIEIDKKKFKFWTKIIEWEYYKYERTKFFNNNSSVKEILERYWMKNYESLKLHIDEKDFKDMFLLWYIDKKNKNRWKYDKNYLILTWRIYSDKQMLKVEKEMRELE